MKNSITNLVLLMVLGMTGCEVTGHVESHPAPNEVAKEAPKEAPIVVPATKEAVTSALNAKTKAMGLHWRAFCVFDYTGDPNFKFLAVAHYPGGDNDNYDRWMERGATQLEAAQALLVALDGAPTHPKVIPKPKPEPQHHEICPPEWAGGARP